MPISAPKIPAMIPPAIMAISSRSVGSSIWKPFSSQPDVMIPEKAPMLMNPAWPRLSSPLMPTTRFRETAITIQLQIWMSWPFSVREMDLLLIITVRMMNSRIRTP